MPERSTKCLVVALGKSDTRMEKAFIDSLRNGTLKPLDLKFLRLEYPGITRSGDKVFMDSRKMPHSISDSLIIMSSLAKSPLTLLRINAERIAIIKQLNELGYRVLVPDYGLTDKSVMDRVRPYARVFRAKAPIAAKMGITTEYEVSACWTRDLWQKIGGVRIKRFNGSEPNPCGEGGLSVPISNNATLVNYWLEGQPLIRELAANGHRFYFLKDGMQLDPKLSSMFSVSLYRNNDHIDLFVGVGEGFMLVDRSYFVNNRPVLEAASEENGLDILLVPKCESHFYPANFKPLDGNRVIVDKRAVNTIALLRQNGIDAIPTAAPLNANMNCGGGIRCFVNDL
ncbi:MAG: hypothetical protein ABSE71_01620 [Candidatus Micrarchaeaceae archaeon]|jgi:hypothetical protein|nr:hypothetical protein [Candidatus Micrarchaeota archaeon]